MFRRAPVRPLQHCFVSNESSCTSRRHLPAGGSTVCRAVARLRSGRINDGNSVVQQGSTILESGSYSMADARSNVYTLTGNNGVVAAEFANLPNQNDSYTVAGNALTLLKYDLYGGGHNLRLKLDGTYELLDGFTVVDTGSYAIAVPEPTSAAIAAVGAACALGRRLRRRRSALQGC